MKLEILNIYIQLAILNWYSDKIGKIEKIYYNSYNELCIRYSWDYWTLKVRHSTNLEKIITSKNFIDAISKWIMSLWHYRDEYTCIRDIIDKTWIAIYKWNLEEMIIEMLKLENK